MGIDFRRPDYCYGYPRQVASSLDDGEHTGRELSAEGAPQSRADSITGIASTGGIAGCRPGESREAEVFAMSFLRHRQIYQSDVLTEAQGEAVSGSAPSPIVLMSLRPAIPWQVGLHQSPPPLHQPVSILNPPAETVNHHPARAGEFSTGRMGNFQPVLTKGLQSMIQPNRVRKNGVPERVNARRLLGRKAVAGKDPSCQLRPCSELV